MLHGTIVLLLKLLAQRYCPSTTTITQIATTTGSATASPASIPGPPANSGASAKSKLPDFEIELDSPELRKSKRSHYIVKAEEDELYYETD